MNRPRKYDRLIQLWKTTESDDGYGGYIVTDALQSTFWANVQTKTARNQNDNGRVDNINQVIFTIRNRYDIDINIKDNFILYQGKKYQISNVLNQDLQNIEVEIVCNGIG
jgi:SPP1 family predicted phage head-tail adaptor